MSDSDGGLYGDIGDLDGDDSGGGFAEDDSREKWRDASLSVNASYQEIIPTSVNVDPDFSAIVVLTGLRWYTTDANIEEFLLKIERPKAIHFKEDAHNGKSTGIAFIELSSSEACARACSELRGARIDGRDVEIVTLSAYKTSVAVAEGASSNPTIGHSYPISEMPFHGGMEVAAPPQFYHGNPSGYGWSGGFGGWPSHAPYPSYFPPGAGPPMYPQYGSGQGYRGYAGNGRGHRGDSRHDSSRSRGGSSDRSRAKRSRSRDRDRDRDRNKSDGKSTSGSRSRDRR